MTQPALACLLLPQRPSSWACPSPPPLPLLQGRKQAGLGVEGGAGTTHPKVMESLSKQEDPSLQNMGWGCEGKSVWWGLSSCL